MQSSHAKLYASDCDPGIQSCQPIVCPPITAQDFGLPEGNRMTSDYNSLRVYHKDGTVQTVPDDYVLTLQPILGFLGMEV